MIKGKIHQDDISILTIYAPNARLPTFIKEILLKLTPHIEHYTLIVGDFNATLLPNVQVIQIESKQRNNRGYVSNGSNRYLENISPTQKKLCLLLSISCNLLQN